MDDRVKSLLDRVRDTAIAMGEMAGEAAHGAGKYVGQVADAAKLNGKLLSLKADINGLLTRVGQLVYQSHNGSAAEEETLDALLHSLDEKYIELEAVRGQISQVRNGRTCNACAALCAGEDKFCKNCGAPL